MAETAFDDWLLRENDKTCRDLGRTRRPFGPIRPGANKQSYQNCGLECCRQIINRVRQREGKQPVSEQLLLLYALRNGFAQGPLVSTQVPLASLRQFGGTTAGDRRDLLRTSALRQSCVGAPSNPRKQLATNAFKCASCPP